jgi:NADPH:quinone reductase
VNSTQQFHFRFHDLRFFFYYSFMKAVTIVAHGGVEGLEVRELETPSDPTADRVLVRVHAAGLNRADILQRLGRYPAPTGVSQTIPGLEFAGEIASVGPEVREWQPGQRVFGITAGGAQAEYVVAPANTLAEIPANLNWAEAASIPEAFITAHDALFTQANLRLSESLLVHAAGSGVGTAAIQLARAAGARVLGTSREAAKLEQAKPYGLDKAITVGDDPQNFVATVKEWTGGLGVDVVLDLVGGAYLEANLMALAPRGRLMLVGTISGAKATLDFSQAMGKRLRIIGTVLRTRSNAEKAAATRLFAQQVVPLFASGVIRPVIDRTYRLTDIRAAHTHLESNNTFGKIVVTID